MPIESIVLDWFFRNLESQGATWGLLIVAFYWLTKRIEYLDHQIATYNTFMRECVEKQLSIKIREDILKEQLK